MAHFDENDLPLLRKYLQGLLSGKEKEKVESKAQDPEGEQDLKFYRALFRVLEQEEDRKIKEALRKEEAGVRDASPNYRLLSRLRRNWKWAAAAAMALILALSIWMLQEKEPAYFEPYPVIGQNIRRADPSLSPEENAFYWYSQGRYRRALQYFQELPVNTNIAFYQANALLALNRPAEAADLLMQVVEEEGSVLAEPAKYYLGLALFLSNEKTEARRWLNEALQSPAIAESYKVTAREILKEINH